MDRGAGIGGSADCAYWGHAGSSRGALVAKSWDPTELLRTGCFMAAVEKHVCGRIESETFHGDVPSGGDKATWNEPFCSFSSPEATTI